MRFFISFFLTVGVIVVQAQSSAALNHYQRHWESMFIHLPCDIWDSKTLEIPISESMYSQGVVTIKNCTFRDIGRLYYSVSFENNRVVRVELSGKGAKRIRLITDLYKNLSEKNRSNKQCNPKIELYSHNREATLLLSVQLQK